MRATPSALASVVRQVRDEWIDYNGHLNEAYYISFISDATDELLIEIGMGPDYRSASKCSLFTAESHIRYLGQILPESTVEIRNYIISVDVRKIVSWHEIWSNGELAATAEQVGVHVDSTTGRACPFPLPIRSTLVRHLISAPEAAGRSISLTGQVA